MAAEVVTLPNGMRIVTDPMDHVETAALGVWVATGTRHEPVELNGISHLLEHMAFKGTATRSARDIAEQIENVGGSLNAYTGREMTAYHAAVLKEDVALAVLLIGDILRNSAFAPEELERERGVILQEIGQALDTPDDIIFDSFQATALPDQPLGRPVLGSEDSVRSIARERLFDYLRRRYTAGNMVLSAAGRIDPSQIRDLALRHFGDVAPTAPDQGPPVSMRYGGGEVREDKELEQVHLVLGCEGIGYRDPDYYALSVFSTLFGGGMSSRLFQRIREERGLVYSIYSFNAGYADGGLFGIYAGTGAESLGELIPVMCEEFARVADNLDEAEIARARNQLKAGTLMALESSHARCEQWARHLLMHGRLVPLPEIVSRIEAVDATAIRRLVRRLLGSTPTLAALGPLGNLEPLDRIRARLAA